MSDPTDRSSLSHLRRINTPLAKEGKAAKPRQLHNTHWGYMCPAEVPEGQACGLVEHRYDQGQLHARASFKAQS